MADELDPVPAGPAGARAREGRPVEILILLVLLAAWFVLQAWVLPKLGVPT